MSFPHLESFEGLNSLLKVIIVAQFAKESFIGRKLSIVELFWIIETLIGKKPFVFEVLYALGKNQGS